VNLQRLLPPRRTKVLSIQCGLCCQWRKPRHIRVPAMVCRDCETTPAFQSWRPVTTRPVTSVPASAGGAR
jgi:hypothetical protein